MNLSNMFMVVNVTNLAYCGDKLSVPMGDAATVFYRSYDLASSEARRLAEKHRGQEFLVIGPSSAVFSAKPIPKEYEVNVKHLSQCSGETVFAFDFPLTRESAEAFYRMFGVRP